ncbi:hypothetical protein CRG98_041384 [Punica granatum]|uniref:Reverse transcriptase Ty1/copia-type domain-containing protein n=1 Tax=Punica granatum TaxID=22663 RepID=A0A2I0I2L0_PUNGR|nr:hypothetical protein CRG98_041384 [Punica granatum]
MAEEICALESNNTWTIDKLPPGKHLIGCKWVNKVKQCADGSVECYKARIVVKGFAQVEGINYHETFAAVAKPASRNWFSKFADALQKYGFANQVPIIPFLPLLEAEYSLKKKKRFGQGRAGRAALTGCPGPAGPNLKKIKKIGQAGQGRASLAGCSRSPPARNCPQIAVFRDFLKIG